MKVSEITNKEIAEYLKLEYSELTEGEKNELTTLIVISKSFIKGFTGLEETAMDEHEDFVIVVYILCQDMYDNRTLYVEKSSLNKVVDTILGMYSINLL